MEERRGYLSVFLFFLLFDFVSLRRVYLGVSGTMDDG